MLDFLIAPAYAQTVAEQPNPLYQIAIFGGLFILMYLLLIRPQRKRQKEHQKLINDLKKGDEVVLTSGLLGKIIAIDDHYITLKAGKSDNSNKGAEMIFQRISVHSILPKDTLKNIQ